MGEASTPENWSEQQKPLLRIRSDGQPYNTLVTTEDGVVIPVTKVTWQVGTEPVMCQAVVEVPLAFIDATTRDYLIKDSSLEIQSLHPRVRELLDGLAVASNWVHRGQVVNVDDLLAELRKLLLNE